MTQTPVVEVVVCTRNRARLLAGACEAILAQDYPAELWRLVIVDNASTDDTFDVAQTLARRFERRVHAVREPRIGHSAARNAGVRATSAPLIAFTDDDALPDPAWLRTLVETMNNSGALAGGGPVDPIISGEPPRWFLPHYLVYLAIWRPPEETTTLTYNNYPRGVNLAFRREVFERFGGFSTRLGLRGERQLYCEETEMCLRIERGGGTIIYSPLSTVRHHVEADRLTIDWISRRFYAQGRSEAILNWIHGGFRGLVLGSRVHRANAPASTWQSIANIREGLDEQEMKQAAEIWTRCRRLALRGYLRQAAVAAATVPRYRALDGAPVRHWNPL